MITEERIFKKWFAEGAFGKMYEDLTEEDKIKLSETLSYRSFEVGVLLNEALQAVLNEIKKIIK